MVLTRNCSTGKRDIIVIGNGAFRYEISSAGKNISFKDKTTGTDYLDAKEDTYCAYFVKKGTRQNVTSVTKRGRHLFLEFSDAGVNADILVKKSRDRISFTVNEITGDPESVAFLNIPLTLEGMPYESFSACALSMNLYTHVRQIPALQTHLWAACYSKFGLNGAEVTLVGAPPDEILPLIRDVISKADDIPFSDKGGAWALMEKEGYGSYLMNFGTLTEETVDDWINMCRNLGFNQIDNHGGGDFFRFGDFMLNPEKWPDGWESFKRINDRLHEAGISSIFHTYAFFIDKNSLYVTPVPSKGLASFSTFTLAGPLGENDSEMIVNESTAGISTTTGFFVRNSVSLRIGTEIIEFSGITYEPPYKFTGLKRGACGTKASSHSSGNTAYHLREMFGRFVPDPGSSLFETVAAGTASIVNQCGFDGIYFDAIDGSDILGGEEDFWYYGTKFIFEVAKRLKNPVGMEMSSMSHHWWHYRSRWQAWDRPVRGYKRFVDIHTAAIKSTRLFLPAVIKSNENEHGLWRGHTPLIDKYAGIENGGLLLPLHLGWWGNQTWNPPQVEPTFPDDVEYLCCKMLGNNAGASMLGGIDRKNLDANPLFRQLVDIIRQYEELRHSNYFSDTIKTLLRQPGKEFSLFRDYDGNWNFKPVSYQKHKVTGLKNESSKWLISNEFESQPLKLRIEPLMSVKHFNDPSAVIIADFSDISQFSTIENSEGVTGTLIPSFESTPDGRKGLLFNANVMGSVEKEGLWVKAEKKFDPWLDISNNQGLGVWINGDGGGQLLNLRTGSPVHLSHGARGDHFIKIDFKGWKYFELVEIESSEFSNYIWPDSGFYVYDSYRHTVRFDNIDKLQIWYNNLHPGREFSCVIGTIKALPLVPVTITDPFVKIGNEKIVFPVTMEPGMYLEFRSDTSCSLYGPKGELIQEVNTEGNIPLLQNGLNEISFGCLSQGTSEVRVQVTVISEGDPLVR